MLLKFLSNFEAFKCNFYILINKIFFFYTFSIYFAHHEITNKNSFNKLDHKF